MIPKRLSKFVILGGVTVLAAGLFFAGRNLVSERLNAWKVLPRPEHFTELYFTDPTNLPKTFNDDPEAINFTIHNLEGHKMDYNYTLTAATLANHEETLGSGTLTIERDATENLNWAITIPPLDRRVKIRISLQYQGVRVGQDKASPQTQSIQYWVNKAT